MKTNGNYLAIDGGTTNTRLALIQNGSVTAVRKIGVGARMNRENPDLLTSELRAAILAILSENGLAETDVCCILASGMITSEFGLCPLPHLTAPVGLAELHDGMHPTALPAISPIPFVFLRGVKIDSQSFAEVDMMRGEETELMGLATNAGASAVYVLPGSHSKIVELDSEGRITTFSTMLSGEMIYALSQHTILCDAVDLSLRTTDENYLLRGYDFAHEAGISRALFKARILKNLFRATPAEVYSYFLGVVLAPEIDSILASEAQTVIIGGKSEIKSAMATLLRHRSDKHIQTLSDEAVDRSVFLGALRIFTFNED